ncbi:MAG TPA: hypothetical protein VIM55_20370 [Mucilaginibacter sp.]
MKIIKTLFAAALLFAFSSCQPGIQDGASLSANHINYIKSLGLLAADEHIILFDSQYRIKISGNFFTDKRIASYWINEQDTKKSTIDYAFYNDVDSMKIVRMKHVAYLKVHKTDGHTFKVVVKANTLETGYFLGEAMKTWLQYKNRNTKHQ